MPYPDKPQIQTSYTGVEQSLGDGSLPGQELDVDLANLKASVEALIDFIKIGLRSDGKLTNGSVTSDALAASIRIGFNPPAPWATSTVYTTVDTVFQGFGFYLCTAPHTAGTFATDLAAGRWLLLADLTPPSDALIAANNLTDLADTAAARSNLGLGTMATAVAGTGATQFQTNAQNDADFQPLAGPLTSWAGVTRASGFDAFAATPTSASLRALLTDEVGTGAAYFVGGDLGTPAGAVLTNATGLPFAGVAASAVRLSSEGYTSLTDVELCTTSWVSGLVNTRRVQGSWIATTSGGAIDFTGVPATAKEVVMYLDAVSLSGVDSHMLQLISGSVETTGYAASNVATSGSALATANPTNSFTIPTGNAAMAVSGYIHFRLAEAASNQWMCHGNFFRANGNNHGFIAGSKSLASALTGIRLTQTSASTFDGGRARLEWII